MVALRALILVPAILLAFMSTDSMAQGRGRGNQGRGQGPAFCRSGQGHPVYGWQWCVDHGWGQGAYGNQRNRARRNDRYGNQYPEVYRGGRRGDFAFDRGYSDGYEKGLEDVSKNRSFDPTRHGWYRSADRGYDSVYGTKAEYQNIYRDGFRDGYSAGFNDRYRNDRNSGSPGPTGSTARRRWPI
jgi:hypothetical protein